MTIFKKIVTDIYIVSWALFKVLIPTLIVVKIAEMAGAVYWLNVAMAPIVTMIGLPADMAIVLTTTMLTNPYAGLMLLSAMPSAASLSVAQTTIIASFMLFAHSLPVEAAITRNAGLRVGVTLVVRVGAAILFCALLNIFFNQFNVLGETARLHLPQFDMTPSLLQWGID
ncbi:MAG: nucleoside recognition domain-containing protein, partial [Rhodobacteraceae bacterium]|nr:nucleoside recognition domain-containing protein [Paracoccaceae bacterium]